MRRHVIRLFIAILLGTVPALLGGATALLFTETGRLLTGRLVAGELGRIMRGRFEVARVSGNFLRTLEFDNVVIRDTTGDLLADVPHIGVTYKLPNLIAGRIILDDIELDRGTIRIVKQKDGRLNFQEIFKLGEGKGGGGSSPLIELRNARLHSTTLEALLPWNPPDTAKTDAAKAAALAADRAKPGRVIMETRHGYRKLVTLDAINARLSRLLISSPTHEPLTFEIDSLSTRISDPAITIVQLDANGWTRADTLQFTVEQARLPNTRASGSGTLTWPKGPVLYDFAMVATQADLKDFWWITPKLPQMTGKARVVAKSRDETFTSYALRGLELQGEKGRVTGQVTLLVDNKRGLGADNMKVDLAAVDMDVLRPFLDTLPFYGTLTGKMSGRGYLDALTIDYDGIFSDSAVEGGAENRLSLAGLVHLGGPPGAVFDTMELRETDLDLATIRKVSPSLPLQGRLQLVGTLSGPWKNVTFSGTVRHHDDGHPETVAEGVSRLDTRDSTTTRFATDVRLDPLDFDGLRTSFPTLKLPGHLQGPLKLSGTMDSMRVDGDLHGEIGHFRATGGVRLTPGKMGGDSLLVDFEGVDLAQLRQTPPKTQLTGTLFVNGTMDSVTGPQGTFAISLAHSTAAGVPLDTVIATLSAENGILTFDTLLARLPGVAANGEGTLGWRAPSDGEINVAFRADSLVTLDPFLRDTLTPPSDSEPPHPVQGRVTGTVSIAGAVDAPAVRVDADARALEYKGFNVPTGSATLDWSGSERSQLGLVVTLDSVRSEQWTMTSLTGEARGYTDSLLWSGSAKLPDSVSLAASGEWWKHPPAQVVAVDSARLTLPDHTWRLQAPVSLTLGQERFDFSPLFLEASDGSGLVRVEGSLPREQEGKLTISAIGLDLRDVYLALQRDTTRVGGTVQADIEVGGTAAAPTFQGTASLADLALGDLASPYVQGVVNYVDRRLDANVLLWKTGTPVMRLEAALPIDLALKSVPKRQLPGDLLVRAVADSTDMSVLEAFTNTVRGVHGNLRMDAQVTGSWDKPSLAGFIDIRNAEGSVPSLGTSFSGINGRARLSGDSIQIDTLLVKGGKGSMEVTGALRLEELTRPILGLTLRANRFRAIADRRFLTLDATGNLELTGPVMQAHLTGRVVADEGNFRFSDLLTKRIVNLENPADSELIDISELREELSAAFQNRFLDSLTIENLRLVMGESFWLRSSEANIQLDGDLTVNKVRDQYRMDGTLSALRGTYSVRIGFVVRDFTVEEGTVRYFGTPDLNAELNVTAKYLAEDIDTRQEIEIIAKITGTLLQPKLALESDQHPPLSETELVSYLMFGRSSFAVNSGGAASQNQSAALATGISYFSSALSSEIQRTLISDLGVPIDYLDIRPGTVSSGSVSATSSGASQVAQVTAGWQVGRKWYLALLTDVCTSGTNFYPSAEYRLNRPLRFKLAVEPTTPCTINTFDPSQNRKRYQVGLDTLWSLDY
ncbi:MAG TPA: translocation/assembly module TamB domain-containing protein [Gemmatimonadales bacterium]|jgi:translocation and assembly module TamB